jgi:hypothetical protein
MQAGSVTIESRKHGPDVWCFRWREPGADGRRIHRRIVLGTAEDLKSIASARKMVLGSDTKSTTMIFGLEENQSCWQIYRGTTSSESLLTATRGSRIRRREPTQAI